VSVLDPHYTDLHRAKFQEAGYVAARLPVVAVRDLELDVIPAPDREDPRHALITGMPDVNIGDQEMARANWLAQQLAARAVEHTFPSQS
jgi:hypothetical protein